MTTDLERAARAAVKVYFEQNDAIGRVATMEALRDALPPLPLTREELVARVVETVPGYTGWIDGRVEDWVVSSLPHMAACRALVQYDEEATLEVTGDIADWIADPVDCDG